MEIELDTAATQELFDTLSQLYEVQQQGVATGDQKYVVAKEEDVLIIDDRSKAKAIQELLDQGHSAEIWRALAEKNPALADRLAAARVQFVRHEAIEKWDN